MTPRGPEPNPSFRRRPRPCSRARPRQRAAICLRQFSGDRGRTLEVAGAVRELIYSTPAPGDFWGDINPCPTPRLTDDCEIPPWSEDASQGHSLKLREMFAHGHWFGILRLHGFGIASPFLELWS
ncbi:uncharacterized protein M8220_010417 [Acridotheres tristis]